MKNVADAGKKNKVLMEAVKGLHKKKMAWDHDRETQSMDDLMAMAGNRMHSAYQHFECYKNWIFLYTCVVGCDKQFLKMAKGLIWATAEDLARNKGRVLSLYRQILRSLNSPNLPLNLAARLSKKAEVRAIFMVAAEERSLHNVEDLIDTGEYALSLLRKGEIPKYIQ
ncbi:hypothetical protein ACET3Z_031152 [Daucus carota]